MSDDLATPPRYDDLPDLCTPEQARAFLQVGKNKIYQMLKDHEIQAVHFGRLVRIPRASLLETRNGHK
jgi:excisionase family DNA binding protein